MRRKRGEAAPRCETCGKTTSVRRWLAGYGSQRWLCSACVVGSIAQVLGLAFHVDYWKEPKYWAEARREK